jgi:hypothetical protein
MSDGRLWVLAALGGLTVTAGARRGTRGVVRAGRRTGPVVTKHRFRIETVYTNESVAAFHAEGLRLESIRTATIGGAVIVWGATDDVAYVEAMLDADDDVVAYEVSS